jgi:hypothetical protein
MRKFRTEIKAISPIDGELKTFDGPVIQSISYDLAQQYCDNNGLGYCKVVGELVAVIPMKNGIADFYKSVDYQIPNLN